MTCADVKLSAAEFDVMIAKQDVVSAKDRHLEAKRQYQLIGIHFLNFY